MSLSNITNYITIIVLILVAVCEGITTAIDYVQKHSSKALPKQVMTIDEIAKFVVSEAATLDLSGAEKKAKAVEALLDQAKAEGKTITEPVAKGAVQHAYDEKKANEAKADDKADEAKPIGFVGDSKDDAQK